MGTGHYDRDGEPLTLEQWAYLMEQRDYATLRQTELPNGRWVSTVWLGLDHRFGEGPPLIFESMVFAAAAGGEDLESRRYATEAEALAGHDDLVRTWTLRPHRRLKKRVRAKRIGRVREDREKARRRMHEMARKLRVGGTP